MATTLPVTYPLSVYAGATFTRVFRWKPDGVNPQDFTGWLADFYVARAGSAAVLTLAVGSGLTLNTAGQVGLRITASQTAALPAGTYHYNLDLTDPSGSVTRFLRGRLDVVRDAGPAS